jgi:MEDS: MEthanogen/methylotroph, DcmR Sensory domain
MVSGHRNAAEAAMPAPVTLGIPGLEMQAGDHVCAFYGGATRDDVLVPFLDGGLRAGDKCICVIEDPRSDPLVGLLEPLGEASVERRQLELFDWGNTYLKDGGFAPDRMVRFWDDQVTAALGGGGYQFVRVVGEMAWAAGGPPGTEELVAYESELNRFLPRYPQVILCLYDIRRFGGELVVDMLKTHPKVVLNGILVDNPYYLEPDEFLASRR